MATVTVRRIAMLMVLAVLKCIPALSLPKQLLTIQGKTPMNGMNCSPLNYFAKINCF